MKLKNLIYSLTVTATIFSCSTEDDLIEERIDKNPTPDEVELTATAGSADFTTFVSIGNSLTAGLMDATLYTRGQMSSFPNLLAGRFQLAGGGEFNLPDINSNSGFNTSYNDLANAFTGPATFGKLVLDTSIPGPVPTTPGETMNMVDMADRPSINNLGVPGMRMIELTVNGYGTLNPFYTRFALDPSTSSVLEQALAKQPTFMTYWLGSNDVLSWASGGGVGPDAAENPGVLDQDPSALVSTQSFNATIQGSLQAMFGTYPDLQGIIINIPNITVLPYFQAVKWNVIVMDEATAEGTSLAYKGYNDFLNLIASEQGGNVITADEATYRQIQFKSVEETDDPDTEAIEGNGVVVTDDQLTDLTDVINGFYQMELIDSAQRAGLLPLAQARQMKSAASQPALINFGLPGEIITLQAGALIGELADPNKPESVIGVGVPLADKYTLTVDEIAKLLTRITMFNAEITAQANQYSNLHLFDANTLFTNVAISEGYTSANGFKYAPDFSPNGIFSTDGIHPNPVGHAIIANEIMAVINAKFGADLPMYEVTNFSTVLTKQ